MTHTALLGTVLATALAAMAPQPAAAMSDDGKKALAALLAIGIGVAAAKHAKEQGWEWDDDRYGEPFSPGPDVVCLPRPKKCYEDGHVSYRWTRRIFGA